MKLFLILLLIIIPINILSQKTYKVYYTQVIKDKSKKKKSILLFDKNQSYFTTQSEKAKTKPYVDEEGSVVNPSNTIDSIANKPKFVYYIKNIDTFYINDINYNEENLVKLNKENENWEISNETKKIKNFICFKATKKVYDKIYIAWYTKKIPYSYGIAAINGLDGLILELYTEDHSIHYTFNKFETTTESINNLMKPYEFNSAISYEKFLELKKQKSEEFKARVYNSLPKDSKILENIKTCNDCK